MRGDWVLVATILAGLLAAGWQVVEAHEGQWQEWKEQTWEAKTRP